MDKHSAPAYSFPSKFKDVLKFDNPGPFTYNAEFSKTKRRQPSATFGSSKRRSFGINDSPAPGHYNSMSDLRPVHFKKNFQKSSRVVFGKSSRDGLGNKSNLGPGSYNPEYSAILRSSSASKFPQKNRSNSTQLGNGPGPVSYNPNYQSSVLKKGPVTKFDKSLRNPESNIKNPGPGQYNIDPRMLRPNASQTFTTEKRNSFGKELNNNPGPATYKTDGLFDKNAKQNKGFKLSQQPRSQNGSKSNLGPGHYNSDTNLKLKNQPCYSIAKSRRSDIGTNDTTPSPATYNASFANNKPRVSSAIMTSRRQGNSRDNSPGPGSYQKAFYDKTLGSGAKYTIPKGVSISKHQQNPSPWSYDPFAPGSIAPVTIGKSERDPLKRPSTPGPTTYNTMYDHKHDSNGITQNIYVIDNSRFTKQKRSTNLKDYSPGPNMYKIPSTIGYQYPPGSGSCNELGSNNFQASYSKSYVKTKTS